MEAVYIVPSWAYIWLLVVSHAFARFLVSKTDGSSLGGTIPNPTLESSWRAWGWAGGSRRISK